MRQERLLSVGTDGGGYIIYYVPIKMISLTGGAPRGHLGTGNLSWRDHPSVLDPRLCFGSPLVRRWVARRQDPINIEYVGPCVSRRGPAAGDSLTSIWACLVTWSFIYYGGGRCWYSPCPSGFKILLELEGRDGAVGQYVCGPVSLLLGGGFPFRWEGASA